MGLRGLSRLIGSLCFKSGLSTTIRVSLIVAPDKQSEPSLGLDLIAPEVDLRLSALYCFFFFYHLCSIGS